MKFNSSKFEHRKYGNEQEIKTATIGISYNSNIDSKDQVRELGIMVNTQPLSPYILEI